MIVRGGGGQMILRNEKDENRRKDLQRGDVGSWHVYDAHDLILLMRRW